MIKHHTSRTSELGLDISIFVPTSGDMTRSRFTIQRGDDSDTFADPGPLLERAIKALTEELADLKNCPVHKDPPGSALASSEHSVVSHLADAWNTFLTLSTAHPDEQLEFRHAIHAAQHIVLSRPALRMLAANASAIEAQRAATAETGAVHQSAVPNGETPQ